MRLRTAVAATITAASAVGLLGAAPGERMGEWIERIGWPQFFERTGLAFTKHHLDTWVGARHTMNMSAHVRF